MECVQRSLLLVIFCLVTLAMAQDCANIAGVGASIDIQIGTTYPNQIPSVLGNPILMKCIANIGISPDVFYDWRKNGALFNNMGKNTLSISSVSSSDGGDYSCSALNASCTTGVSDITTVTTSPTVTVDPASTFSVNEGDSFTLNCFSDGWPQPMIEWFGVTSDNALEPIVQSPVLTVLSASLLDGRQYTCIATNFRNNARRSVTVNVLEVTGGPTTVQVTNSTTSEDQSMTTGPTMFGTVARSETEDGFYIGVAVTAFVCLVLTVPLILGVIIWAVLRKKRYLQESEEDQYVDEEFEVEE